METNTQTVHGMLDAAAQQAAAQQQAEQPQEDSMQVQLRAQELIAQARAIQAITQVDVLALYNTDMDVRARVLSGEWDFVDVYKSLNLPAQPAQPVRSANGGVGSVNIGAMNESQFARLNQLLGKGAKVDMRY